MASTWQARRTNLGEAILISLKEQGLELLDRMGPVLRAIEVRDALEVVVRLPLVRSRIEFDALLLDLAPSEMMPMVVDLIADAAESMRGIAIRDYAERVCTFDTPVIGGMQEHFTEIERTERLALALGDMATQLMKRVAELRGTR